MLVAEQRFTSGEDQAPGLTPAAPTKLYRKMSSIPVVTISLPSCNGCVSPRTVCLNLLVKFTVLFSLLLIQNLHFCFPLADRHTTSLLLTSGWLFSGKADTELYRRRNDQNYPSESLKTIFPSSTLLQSFSMRQVSFESVT